MVNELEKWLSDLTYEMFTDNMPGIDSGEDITQWVRLPREVAKPTLYEYARDMIDNIDEWLDNNDTFLQTEYNLSHEFKTSIGIDYDFGVEEISKELPESLKKKIDSYYEAWLKEQGRL